MPDFSTLCRRQKTLNVSLPYRGGDEPLSLLIDSTRTVEATASNVGDASMLLESLDQIPPVQDIGSVIADGTYDILKCPDANTAHGGHALIPPRKNARPWKPTSAGAGVLLETRQCERPSIWERRCRDV